MDRRPPSDAALSAAVQALGRGFDVTSDARLLYCKAAHGCLVLRPDGDPAADLSGVPMDVDVSRGRSARETTPVCSFLEMAEYFNKRSGLSGTLPLGGFNSMFNFNGSWKVDAVATKALAMDSYLIPIFRVKLKNTDLALRDEVKRAVPRSWNPESLASFIENFGTHIITSVSIGGRDEVYIKQHLSSPLSVSDIEKYVKDVGDRRFLTLENHFNSSSDVATDKFAELSLHQTRDMNSQPFSTPYLSGQEDVTVIFRRRGGDDLVQNHMEWATTVPSSPDVINMTFLPIVSLLDGMPGNKYLAQAIDLYLEYKPPIEELQYFLEFQIQQLWAPIHDNIPGFQRKEPVCPFVQFSLMGPKLYISSEQISVGRKPVTGLRLCLEGSKQNRLAIQLQHFASLPKILQPHWDSHIAIGPPKWQGPEEQDSRWFEPIKWKNFAHVSTTPIEYNEASIGDLSGVYIVTGAQLGVWDFGAKSVLHLKLLFSRVPGCTIRRSVWDHSPSTVHSMKPDDTPTSSIDSSSHISKLSKIVDLTEMSKGPQDTPGHWLVTGAKLGVEKGKIVIRVKYSILNY